MNTSRTGIGRRLQACAIRSAVLALGFVGFCTGTASAVDAASWEKTLEAAKLEGSVSLYVSVAPAQVDAVIAGFNTAYPGIKLEVFRNADSVINQKIQQELSLHAIGADVIFSTKNNFYTELKNEGALVLPQVPAFAEAGSKSYLDVAPIVSRLPLLVAYNTDIVKSSPRNYEDFLAPEFNGMLGIPVVDGSPITTAWWEFLRVNHPGYWEKLAAFKPKVYASSVPLSQALASGEVSAAILASPGSVSALINKGAAIKMVAPDRVFGMDLLVSVFKDAKHPNAALVLADFLLSKAGQEAINSGGLGVSIMPDIPGALPPIAMVTADPGKQTAEKMKGVIADWRNVFGK
ncbi:MAG: extracellular solute-binding protein [Hyphomicrobiales bacterium]|nr:extracellular solute-binding protein [Hyphomicrobiales bacterium]